ncbi:unnamed protein product [marine sediment metagenome]|uniref:Uncharacterized protein n=1 Tax=marine sediment metagenome TaxID=412755 RepID=X0U332_9ZZZZ
MKLSEKINNYRRSIHKLPKGGYFITDSDLARWRANAANLEAENERIQVYSDSADKVADDLRIMVAQLEAFARKVHVGPHHTAIDATKCSALVDWVCGIMDEGLALLKGEQDG